MGELIPKVASERLKTERLVESQQPAELAGLCEDGGGSDTEERVSRFEA
jgi:hypothetical protein